MRHNQASHIQSRRWQQSPEVEEVGEDSPEIVETEEIEVVRHEAVPQQALPPTPIQTPPGPGPEVSPGSKGPSILICPQGTGPGARCTSNSGVLLIFVLIHHHVRGKMYSRQDLQEIENLTNSATPVIRKLIQLNKIYILTISYQKYMTLNILIQLKLSYRKIF